jgi:cell division protease FtsH
MDDWAYATATKPDEMGSSSHHFGSLRAGKIADSESIARQPDRSDAGLMNNRNAMTMRPTMDLINGRDTITVSVTPAAARVVLAWNADQRLMAIHEAGHVVVAAVLPSRICVKSADIKGKHGSGKTVSTENDDDHPTFSSASRIRDRICMALSGQAAEERIIGEASDGSASDLSTASTMASELIQAGLDPDAPYVSTSAFGYGCPIPEWLATENTRAIIATLAVARERARAIVAEHEDAILLFASSLFRARRISDEAVDDALRAAGIEPPPRNG